MRYKFAGLNGTMLPNLVSQYCLLHPSDANVGANTLISLWDYKSKSAVIAPKLGSCLNNPSLKSAYVGWLLSHPINFWALIDWSLMWLLLSFDWDPSPLIKKWSVDGNASILLYGMLFNVLLLIVVISLVRFINYPFWLVNWFYKVEI